MLPPEIAGHVPLDLLGHLTALPAGTARIPYPNVSGWHG
jgi:hypothetical protein